MPVAFNPPPFPTADTAVAAAADSSAATTSPPADAFALLLLAAGGDLAAAAGKNAGAAAARNRLLDVQGGRILADEKGILTRVRPRESLIPIELAKRDDTAGPVPVPNGDNSLDPAAMTAALSAAIASGLATDAPAARSGIAGGPEASATSSVAVSGTPSAALLNAVSGAPGDRSRAGLQRDAGRVDPGLLDAPATLPTTIDLRSNVALAASEASKQLLGELPIKPKEGPDLTGSSVSAAAAFVAQQPLDAQTAIAHTIDTPVTAPGWESEFASKLSQVVMLRNDRAQFHLHPADLGPVDVQISFAADQAVVLITAAHAATRDALEQALPYLRDMLAQQGITLGQASVQSERNPGDPGGSRRDDAIPSPLSQGSPDATIHAVRLRGLVDVFV